MICVSITSRLLDSLAIHLTPSSYGIVFAGAAGTVYAGETYRLRIRFPTNYPIEAPEVVFVPVSLKYLCDAPKHEENASVCIQPSACVPLLLYSHQADSLPLSGQLVRVPPTSFIIKYHSSWSPTR